MHSVQVPYLVKPEPNPLNLNLQSGSRFSDFLDRTKGLGLGSSKSSKNQTDPDCGITIPDRVNFLFNAVLWVSIICRLPSYIFIVWLQEVLPQLFILLVLQFSAPQSVIQKTEVSIWYFLSIYSSTNYSQLFISQVLPCINIVCYSED